ncbi:MAG TPA: ABC transporter permease [Candidatus Polarisedimenticolaceae bacterium]|nr:ABC transporter permease [Candidatus Polarisedimenticolaceae bacterium]
MAWFVLRRLALSVPLVVGVATLVFALLETAPGSPTDLILGDRPLPQEVRRQVERAYGLDRPAHERYARWVGALLVRGDLGWSISRSRPVAEVLARALPATLVLTTAALGIHVLLGVTLGIVSATRRGRWPDRIVTLCSLTLYAMPPFWLGLMAILGLAFLVPLFPASSMQSVGAEQWGAARRFADLLWHLALPAGVLAVSSAAAMTRFVRAGLIESMGQEFVRAARARGVGGQRVVLAHALRGSLGPVVNLIGLSLPVLVSGSLVIEIVFAWPGMGRLTYDAIMAKDLPVVLATTTISAFVVVLGSLIADLALAALDPRVRLGGGRAAP